jgi:NADPH-dependent curcumin reductase CurA
MYRSKDLIKRQYQLTNNKIISKEIHLKKRPTGFVTEDDFELAEVKVPRIKEGEFLVRNIWMSIDPFMRIYMINGSKIRPPIELNKAIDGECIGQISESKSDKFKVGEYVKANFG